MIRIELRTKDPFEVRLATAYWAYNSDGFVFELDEVLRDHGVANKKVLLSLVQEYSEAWIEGSACPVCTRLQRVRNRTEYLEKSSLAKSRPVCADCRSKGLKRPAPKSQSASPSDQPAKFNYQFATDAQKTLLWALSRINEEGFIAGHLSDEDLQQLLLLNECPLLRIIKANGQITKVDKPAAEGYKISTARGLGSTTETLSKYVLTSRLKGDSSIFDLWRQYGAVEGLRYLFNLQARAQLEPHLTADEIDSLTTAFSSALGACSISSLWYRIWIAVEKLKKERSTGPGSQALSTQVLWTLRSPAHQSGPKYPWKRVLAMSALGSLLSDELSIGDDTTPDQVAALARRTDPFLVEKVNPSDSEVSPTSAEEDAAAFMKLALAEGSAHKHLQKLVGLTQEGKTLDAALQVLTGHAAAS